MISVIELDNVIPEVFAADPADTPAATSHVWLGSVSFVKPRGYLVVADSGTGKSSLCSYIYGSRHDYRGTIKFDGTDIREFNADRWSEIRRTALAYLPQEINLFPELTTLENILLKNRLTDYFSEADIGRMLERLKIDDKADVPAGCLSIGQQQRVGIIRSVCQPFDFILLDEPVSHLDAANNALAAGLLTEQADIRQASVVATSVGNHLQFDPANIFRL